MQRFPAILVIFGILAMACGASASVGYPIVDTGQTTCYNNSTAISPPAPGAAFYGQDAQYQGLQPSYRNNNDGSITDLNTGLTWIQARGLKVGWNAAVAGAATCNVGGYADWRMPTVKELYSLINFTGKSTTTAASSTPYLNTSYFGFAYGNTAAGERLIDCQDWSATQYVGTTMNGEATVFGVNFADGRIKGYPKYQPGSNGTVDYTLYARYVRGNTTYGVNNFVNNNNGTITDKATGLMWSQSDNGSGMNWQEALAWVQSKNAANFLGRNNWRLPNAKELQSIFDYSHAPDATNSNQRGPAIDPLFSCTSITNEAGAADYPFYWTSTTHLDNMGAVYDAVGEALGYMQFPPNSGNYQLLDVHGAGAQRSDPKSGDPADYPYGKGPQGDVIRINNYIRLVCDASPVPEPSTLVLLFTAIAGSLLWWRRRS
jgi:hypothetical protein